MIDATDIDMQTSYPKRTDKGYMMTLRHKPTGIVVEGAGWYLSKLVEKLKSVLENKVRKHLAEMQ